jgi:hypothetical protein
VAQPDWRDGQGDQLVRLYTVLHSHTM